MSTVNDKRWDQLGSWLERVNAQFVWNTIYFGGGFSLYSVNGTIVVVHYHDETCGWELYVPASKSGKIADTLAAAEQFLGVTQE